MVKDWKEKQNGPGKKTQVNNFETKKLSFDLIRLEIILFADIMWTRSWGRHGRREHAACSEETLVPESGEHACRVETGQGNVTPARDMMSVQFRTLSAPTRKLKLVNLSCKNPEEMQLIKRLVLYHEPILNAVYI